MRRDEISPILDKLISCCVPKQSKRAVAELLANEKHHYIEPHHGQHILPGLWEIGQAVQDHRVLEIEYERMKEPKLVRRRVLPVGIMFSEYYFYLTAFLEDKSTFDNPDDLFPTIYRIDRIKSFIVLDEYFQVPYKDRFQEGSSVSGCSLCTVANWNVSGLNILVHPLRPCWIVCLRRRSWSKTRRAGLWRLRCLARALRCG
ncbi:MAG: WYL domain-containing protein [Oscillospiraceae bacterium]